jgi:hypothetical protein
MTYDQIKLGIKNTKESAIENYVSGFFIKSPTFFPKIYNKICWGVFSVVSPYLALHVLNLILHLTHNSYNEGKKYLSH